MANSRVLASWRRRGHPGRTSGALAWLLIVVVVVSPGLSGCYLTMDAKVVDAETGEPIEGAVVHVEWLITKGFGLTHHETYEVVEALTDKEGKATISGVLNPFVNPPHVVIYKKGYVAWNNERIFPSYEKRTDFEWKSANVFKMERWKEEYSFLDHYSFWIHSVFDMGKAPMLSRGVDEWGRSETAKELYERSKARTEGGGKTR